MQFRITSFFKKITILSLFYSLTFSTSCALTQIPISQAINTILATSHDDLNVGIIVENTANKQILFQLHPDRLFIPASNMKLFTAYAALSTLGPNFTYQTAIYADPTHLIN